MTRTEKTASHYKLVILLCSVLYPVWKIVAEYNLGSHEPWYTRLIPFFVGSAYLISVKFKPEYNKHAQSVFPVLSSFVIVEYLFLTYSFNNTPHYTQYIVGSFIIMAAFLNAYRTKKEFLIFLGVSLVSFTLYFFTLYLKESTIDQNHFLLLVITTFVANGMITWQNIKSEEFLKKLEVEVDEKKQQLIESSKLASLGEMAGGIAHEINNPLQIISGHIEILEFCPDNKESISSIKETVSRINKIIEGLRLFSRDSAGTSKEPTLISDVLNETLSFCAERFKKSGVHLVTNVENDVYIKCNHVDLSRVFLNLLNNAFDAISEEDMGERSVVISTSVQDQKLILKFRDSGKRISPQLKEKIFNPFFTTKAIGKGTGIGLSMSKGIIEDHGGSLDLNLEPKEFVIELPINDL